jgi:hypothetical protein
MAKFLVTYHGGGMPDSEEARQQVMAAFAAWASKVGDALLDPGAPLGPPTTVTADAVRPGAADSPSTGYSVLQTADLDSVVALLREHPFVARGGALQVTEAVAP